MKSCNFEYRGLFNLGFIRTCQKVFNFRGWAICAVLALSWCSRVVIKRGVKSRPYDIQAIQKGEQRLSFLGMGEQLTEDFQHWCVESLFRIQTSMVANVLSS